MRDSAVRRWSAFHKLVYHVTAGRLGRRLVYNDILLLTTTGHRTGRAHTVPLLYLREGSALILVASYGGRHRHPDWYDNLTADAAVLVQVNGRREWMIARTAAEEERARLWPKILDAYDGYSQYQSRTDREIPVVVLEPGDQGQNETG